jgi:hypothetical protein
MPNTPGDPFFGHFRCLVCGRETEAFQSDADKFLTLECVPMCCDKPMQLHGVKKKKQPPPKPA